MTVRMRVVLGVAVLALALLLGRYWWQQRRVELHGGIQPFMQEMLERHNATAEQLRRSTVLPADFIDMERLAQTAQDIFAVFKDDPRVTKVRFGPLARDLMRRASKLEYTWDHGEPEDAKLAFAELTEACRACHTTLAIHHPPTLSNP